MTEKQINNIERYKYDGTKTIEPYAYGWDGAREQLIEGKRDYECKSGGRYCAKLIQYDGWQISKDYPLKF